MSDTSPEDLAEELSYMFSEDQANAIAGDVYQVLLDKILQMDKELQYWQNEVVQLNQVVATLLEDKTVKAEYVKCPACDGACGWDDCDCWGSSYFRQCRRCEGKGRVLVEAQKSKRGVKSE